MNKAFSVILLSLILHACTRDKGSNNSDDNSALITGNTGWQKVSTIPYMQSRTGFTGYQAMTPYDMTMAGSEIALLYSEDYKLSGVDGHNFFKVKVPAGTVDTKNTAQQLTYARAGNAAPVYHFFPGTYTTVSMQFKDNEASIYDGVTGLIAAAGYGINPMYSTRFYADGTILMGILDSRKITARWSYTYPQVRNFDYVTNEWANDSTNYLHSSPMKLSDGIFYDLVLSSVNNRMYFSVIKNNAPVPVNGNPNFDFICRNRVPELEPSRTYTILSSDVSGDAQTLLLGEFSTTDYTRLAKVHAFRWKKGTTSLERLYGDVSIDGTVSTSLLELGRSVSQPNEIRFKPDGTAYFIVNHSSLYLINAGGAKQYGKLDAANLDPQFQLGICRYFNNAFYALVYPVNDMVYSYNSPKFRMELVKITP